jgi:type IV pilus assembly protein PilC
MAIFQYKARDKNEVTFSGLVEATSEAEAVEMLKERELTVIFVKPEKNEKSKAGFSLVLGRVKPKDVVIFSRQFAVLISANVPVVQSLKIVVDQTESVKLKIAVSQVADEIDAGTRLSEALGKHPKIFSNFYVSVIRSGETSGKLDEVLTYLADEMEKDYDMTSKIKGAMIYPIFVFCGLTGVGVVMMVFVVPKLTAILTETGAELPFATKVLIGMSGFMTSYWWILVIIFGGLAFGVRMFYQTASGRKTIDYLKLRLPVFGHLFQMIYLVRFTRSMQTLIIGGVNITKSLKITADVVSNEIYKDLIEQTVKEVEDGNSISNVFSQSNQIPKMVSQMMSIGEKTGKMDIILQRITEFYSREINNIVANLMTLMEPIIMVVMGVAVGLMVAAIIMPMYNMAQSV